MRVYLTGTRAYGAGVLTAMLAAGHRVVGVTAPVDDRLALAASLAGVPCRPDLNPAAVKGAEVLVAAHSHAFVGRKTRRAVEAAIGYHPSLLPLHRGRDAVRWTIRDRDRVTGGTIYHLTDAVDAGPVAAQAWCFVHPADTARSLWRRELAPMGVRLTLSALADLDAGHYVCVAQDEALATWEPSLDAPPLFRPELPELASGASRWVYDANPAALTRA